VIVDRRQWLATALLGQAVTADLDQAVSDAPRVEAMNGAALAPAAMAPS
jgi:hypothetical protein